MGEATTLTGNQPLKARRGGRRRPHRRRRRGVAHRTLPTSRGLAARPSLSRRRRRRASGGRRAGAGERVVRRRRRFERRRRRRRGCSTSSSWERRVGRVEERAPVGPRHQVAVRRRASWPSWPWHELDLSFLLLRRRGLVGELPFFAFDAAPAGVTTAPECERSRCSRAGRGGDRGAAGAGLWSAPWLRSASQSLTWHCVLRPASRCDSPRPEPSALGRCSICHRISALRPVAARSAHAPTSSRARLLAWCLTDASSFRQSLDQEYGSENRNDSSFRLDSTAIAHSRPKDRKCKTPRVCLIKIDPARLANDGPGRGVTLRAADDPALKNGCAAPGSRPRARRQVRRAYYRPVRTWKSSARASRTRFPRRPGDATSKCLQRLRLWARDRGAGPRSLLERAGGRGQASAGGSCQ